MTTTNGGSQSRIVDHAEGIVQASKPRGLRLIGEQDYRNFSKYAQPPIAPPARGAHVVVGRDPDGFIRELRIEPRMDVGPAESSDGAREIRKQVAAKVAGQLLAAAIASHEDAGSTISHALQTWLSLGSASQELSSSSSASSATPNRNAISLATSVRDCTCGTLPRRASWRAVFRWQFPRWASTIHISI
jgi:hypothetical protein